MAAGERYGVIIVDEAQDLTPCQSSIFFEQRHAVVYLFGDEGQRIYGWRGAQDTFETTEADGDFSLTNSFRFGAVVGRVAQKILTRIAEGMEGRGRAMTIRGMGRNRGASVAEVGPGDFVGDDNSVERPRMVVLTRSNKGVFDALLFIASQRGGEAPRWRFVAEGAKGRGGATTAGLFRKKDFEGLVQFWLDWCAWRGEQYGSDAGVLVSADNLDDPVPMVALTFAGDGEAPAASGASAKKSTNSAPPNFSFDGEEFEDWEELKSYAEEFGFSATITKMLIVEERGEKTLELVAELMERQTVETETTAQGGAGAPDWDIMVSTVHGAKGLEFAETVLLWDDFAVDRLPPGGQQNQRKGQALSTQQRELLNLLYVGVTRAQKTLRICPELWGYLESLGVEEEHADDDSDGEEEWSSSAEEDDWAEGEDPKQTKKREKKEEKLREKREAWGEAVIEFDAWRSSRKRPPTAKELMGKLPDPPGAKLSDVVKKSAAGADLFCLAGSSMDSGEIRLLCRRGLLLYHPDKLFSGGAAGVSDKQREGLNRLAQWLHERMAAERLADPDVPARRPAWDEEEEEAAEEEEEFSEEEEEPPPKRRKR